MTLSGSRLYGMTASGGSNNDGTVFALNIAPASIVLNNISNTTIISGGTATFGATVSNSPNAGYNLNYTLTANVQSGNATLGTMTSGTGSLAPSASQSCTISATSTNLGVNTISFTASDPNASNSPQTTAATLTVLGHAVPSLTTTSQTVIAGATVPSVSLTLSNGTAGQSGLASLDVNALGSGVSGPVGGVLVASGCTQSYSGSLNLNTNIVGVQTQTFSLNAGDDHTLSGALPPTAPSTTATLTVLGHAAPSLSVSGGNNQTIIVGTTVGLNLSNGTQGQSDLASLDVNSLGNGVTGPTGGALVASGSTQLYTASLNTGTFGPQTQIYSLNVGDDHTLPGASAPTDLSTTASLTIFDHSNASLSSTASQTTQALSFGNVLRGASVPSQSFTIYNLAANTSAAYTANMKLTGSTTSGDPAMMTNLSTFNGLTPGNGNTFTASLNTSNYTTSGTSTITMSASQLADDEHLARGREQQQRGDDGHDSGQCWKCHGGCQQFANTLRFCFERICQQQW